jgi:hypothetical protein
MKHIKDDSYNSSEKNAFCLGKLLYLLFCYNKLVLKMTSSVLHNDQNGSATENNVIFLE